MAKQIEVSRIFNAPVEMVWKVWTDPEMVKRWWGPKHFTAPVAEIDFRVGGKSLVSMRAPHEFGGQEHYSIWEYVEIIEHISIEFIQRISNENGEPIPPATVGLPEDFPLAVNTLVTFKIIDSNKTEMRIMEQAEFGSISNFAQLGLEQTMEKIVAIFN
mgnify:FL=1